MAEDCSLVSLAVEVHMKAVEDLLSQRAEAGRLMEGQYALSLSRHSARQGASIHHSSHCSTALMKNSRSQTLHLLPFYL